MTDDTVGDRTGDDPQDMAETFDEDVLGSGGRVLSDEARVDFPPDHLHGVPFADADVTDESLADRLAQEEPEVFPEDEDQPIDPDTVPIDPDELVQEQFPDPDEL